MWTLYSITLYVSSPLFSALSGCYLNCFLGPLSCMRELRQIGISGPKCPTSSPSVGCLATTASTSWTKNTSCYSPRVLSGVMTNASTVALKMQREEGVSDTSGRPAVSWRFLWSNKRLRIPFSDLRGRGLSSVNHLDDLAGHAEWTGQSFRLTESDEWFETAGSMWAS